MSFADKDKALSIGHAGASTTDLLRFSVLDLVIVLTCQDHSGFGTRSPGTLAPSPCSAPAADALMQSLVPCPHSLYQKTLGLPHWEWKSDPKDWKKKKKTIMGTSNHLPTDRWFRFKAWGSRSSVTEGWPLVSGRRKHQWGDHFLWNFLGLHLDTDSLSLFWLIGICKLTPFPGDRDADGGASPTLRSTGTPKVSPASEKNGLVSYSSLAVHKQGRTR